MITGEHRVSLDDKGRLLIPSKIRNELSEGSIVLTKGIDKCLWMFPLVEWERIASLIMEKTSAFNRTGRALQRRIIAPSQEIEIDKAGRINIGNILREYADLTKDCVVLGVKNYLEIWDETRYKEFIDNSDSDFLEAAEELGDFLNPQQIG
ncbi:division/cell wall cluster transcriptional repressor MraZ [Spirochaeta cellobiosiphila]|uniref:division/cell wall cluster transcriptional repressor MraZ n=1 Tax=Spirochaeta cellobiosiphila TaxID=504483 RepID=UPI0004217100|nr:division/cell wall cluster transcriptional repressor MraZ [Spirochaeta cellobiosiphila]